MIQAIMNLNTRLFTAYIADTDNDTLATGNWAGFITDASKFANTEDLNSAFALHLDQLIPSFTTFLETNTAFVDELKDILFSSNLFEEIELTGLEEFRDKFITAVKTALTEKRISI